ncbi:septation protein IspZ [Sphingobium phenoxybenzoativorans]|uniref:Inner membrane-spanning protein YciB n=1 Tax=Sphingobium phenoxybenzoativorans TaxID=1592790 RepID=A0A975Q3F5_9SPHN|nr:septation protein IspZ [Sphingobium phenoxybenzoativorans]QUT07467.1 septation protein IspZ [Sphingobium phenoxybenzoativorans]
MIDPTPQSSASASTKPAHSGTLSLALDFGPLLVFFVAYKMLGVIMGTAAFMAAIALAVIVSIWKLGRVSPMLWLSAVLVLFFGSLTIYFHDERFIQIKPTIIYSFFALMLFAGLLRGKPLLKYLLQAAYDGLSEEGWKKLSRNWAYFFVFMAALNEAMRATLSFDTWLSLKVWGVTAISFIFAASNIPMLMRHGMNIGEKVDTDEVGGTAPPQG